MRSTNLLHFTMKRTTLFITSLVLMTSVTFSQNKVNIKTSFYKNGNKSKEINNDTGERKYFYVDGRVLFGTEVIKRDRWGGILKLGGHFQDKEGNQFVGSFFRPPEDYVGDQSVVNYNTEDVNYTPPDDDYFYFLRWGTGLEYIDVELDNGETFKDKFEDQKYEYFSISKWSNEFEEGLERQVCFGPFKEEVKVGKHQCFYETGEPLLEFNYTDEPYSTTFSSGESLLTGPFIVYWKNGNKIIEGQYTLGRKMSREMRDRTGSRVKKIYIDGGSRRSGIWKLFDENGKVFDEIMF